MSNGLAPSADLFLAGDIGGTKTNLALVTRGAGGFSVTRLQTYHSREHASLSGIVAHFLGGTPPPIAAAGFGVAGPVREHCVRTTNLPWSVNGADLAAQLGLPRVALLNDVEAIAWAIPELERQASIALQAGDADGGHAAVVAAGTGLGMAALLRGDGPVRSLASEGGHADFAPIDEFDIELLRFLQARFGRVSTERVVSGPGLVNIYEFLRVRDGSDGSAVIDTTTPSAGAEIGHAALTGTSELAERAVLALLRAYGAAAGNWALAVSSGSGLWLGGGLARKLLFGPAGTSEAWRARAREAFLSRFLAKGRLSPLLEAMPVRVIETDEAPLFGATHCALAGG